MSGAAGRRGGAAPAVLRTAPPGYLDQDEGPVVKGWCPGALRPMESGDGLVVRVRVPGGRLTQAQAAGVAALAAACGSGWLDLSARANLQLRGVTEASHPRVLEGLEALGLLDATREAEARRNILVTPFADAQADAIAAGLARALVEAAPALPGKFGFAVDTGPAPVLAEASADVRIERHAGGLLLRADGMTRGRGVSAGEAAAEAVRLAEWFLAAGGAPGGRGRMRALIARGVRPPGHDLSAPAAAEAAPQPGLMPEGALVGAAFGQIEAAQLAALAVLGPLRLTPWRMLLIEGLAAMPELPGLITSPGDPLLAASACTGAPGCPQALGPTRALARALAGQVPGLHVSGCGKGCAHPGAARVTLVAAGAGRYDLIRDGRAGDPPHLTGLDPEAPDFAETLGHAASV